MLTKDEKREMDMLRAENAKLKLSQTVSGGYTWKYKVSVKGAVSVYGAGRFPVTLYAKAWLALLDAQGAPADAPLRKFIAVHKNSLSWEKVKAEAAEAEAETEEEVEAEEEDLELTEDLSKMLAQNPKLVAYLKTKK